MIISVTFSSVNRPTMPFYFVDFEVKLTLEAAQVLPRPPAVGLQGRNVKAQGEALGKQHPKKSRQP